MKQEAAFSVRFYLFSSEMFLRYFRVSAKCDRDSLIGFGNSFYHPKVMLCRCNVVTARKCEGEASKTELILLKKDQWDQSLSHQHSKMQKLSGYINIGEPL